MKSRNIFQSRFDFESAVEINADTAGMMERTDVLSIVRTYSSAEQKGRLAVVVSKHAPIEMQSAASNGLTFGVEQEVVDKPFKVPVVVSIFGSGDGNSLDDNYWEAAIRLRCAVRLESETGTECTNVVWTFVAVKLDGIEVVVGNVT